MILISHLCFWYNYWPVFLFSYTFIHSHGLVQSLDCLFECVVISVSDFCALSLPRKLLPFILSWSVKNVQIQSGGFSELLKELDEILCNICLHLILACCRGSFSGFLTDFLLRIVINLRCYVEHVSWEFQ